MGRGVGSSFGSRCGRDLWHTRFRRPPRRTDRTAGCGVRLVLWCSGYSGIAFAFQARTLSRLHSGSGLSTGVMEGLGLAFWCLSTYNKQP